MLKLLLENSLGLLRSMLRRMCHFINYYYYYYYYMQAYFINLVEVS